MSSRHQAVLAIFFEEGLTTLSPPALAYRMGVPVREAEALLDDMVRDDLLALDFSSDADFAYRLPPGTLPPEPLPPAVASHATVATHHQAATAWSEPQTATHAPVASRAAHRRAAPQSPWPQARAAAPHHRPPHAPSGPDGTDGSVGPTRARFATAAPLAPASHPGASPRPHSQPAPSRQPANSRQPAPYPAPSTEMVRHRPNLPTPYKAPSRKPFTAGLLSFLCTGLGQVYNGEPLKGGLMLATSAMLWLFWMGWIVSIWSIVDAHTVAERAESPGA
ncbi:hypothetical protein DL240_08185 [Lujinxingia litoralis]|uniref:TM2 domain-containing protein n=1 Tax=Lujinxingia litoralis TaxID=2211119 RepID=A0A328C5K4_9DELT|nr:hypothetical protein [Lujinxingia litoralis]RAL22861.1 hypothetical protein DL240_08185 [Lujinxingia litoralis]